MLQKIENVVDIPSNDFVIAAGATVFGVYQGRDAHDAIQAYVLDAGYTSVEDAAATLGLTVEDDLADIHVEPLRPLIERIGIASAVFDSGAVEQRHVAFDLTVDGKVVDSTLEWLDEDYDLVREDRHLDINREWRSAIYRAVFIEGMDEDVVWDGIWGIVHEKLRETVAELKAERAYDDALDRLRETASVNDGADLDRIALLVDDVRSQAQAFEEGFGKPLAWIDAADDALRGSRFDFRRGQDFEAHVADVEETPIWPKLWLVAEGEATEADETTESDGVNNVLAYTCTEEQALELARLYDAGKLELGNVTLRHNGNVVAALRASEAA